MNYLILIIIAYKQGGFAIVRDHDGFTGCAHVDKGFTGAGIVPDIVLSAIDADVIKTYGQFGLGCRYRRIGRLRCRTRPQSGAPPVPDLFRPIQPVL